MVISQLFVLSLRGDKIISRDCIMKNKSILKHFLDRFDIRRGVEETFFRRTKLCNGDIPPIIVTYIFYDSFTF